MTAPAAGTPPRKTGLASWGARHPWALAATLLLGLCVLGALSAIVGPEPIPPAATLSILLHELTRGSWPAIACAGSTSSCQCSVWVEIVWGARVPALILAILAGAALGMSGAGLQGIFRNPLADPYLLGLSSGAALGASSIYTFGLYPGQRDLFLPIAAFLGGLVPGAVVYIAAGNERRSPETLLLTGVALNAFFSAILSSLLLYNPVVNISVSFWLLGGLSAASWSHDALLLGVLLVAGTLLALHGQELNVLQLGPEVAQSLGSDPRRVVRRVILLTTLVSATAVAFTGIIGFVGLVAPHVVRRLAGADYRRVLALSAIAGGGFLLVAWDLAQVVVPSVVIPVGIPTAFIGALFFLYLLYRRGAAQGRRA
ncbi:MAG: iron ABC transporter permease [Thermoplasmata archaeon]|nr:iron ABC transporter permease [Thermoplasmata archaeon]